jgi:antitoxin HicB
MTRSYSFPANVDVDNATGKVTVSFEGLPGATWGQTFPEAMANAKDLLATSLEMLIEDGMPIPNPPPAQGRPIVMADVEI